VQALAILFGATVTVAICYALGSRLLGAAFTDLGARFVTGGAAFSLLVFGLCAVGLLYPLAILAVCAAALWWNRKSRWWPEPQDGFPYWRILLLVFAIYFVLYFFNSMAPESSFDGSRYHLGLVARYLREHGFHRITWDLYASLSQGAEMLFLAAFAFGRHSAAAMVHFAFLLALAWQVLAYGRRSGSALAGACGALLVFCSPMVGVDGSSAYVDVAAAAAAFTLFLLLQVWDADRSRRLLWAIGMMAGFCYAIKYTGWVAAPYALAVRRLEEPAVARSGGGRAGRLRIGCAVDAQELDLGGESAGAILQPLFSKSLRNGSIRSGLCAATWALCSLQPLANSDGCHRLWEAGGLAGANFPAVAARAPGPAPP